MNISKLSYLTKKAIDIILFYGALSISILWFAQAIIEITKTGELFTGVDIFLLFTSIRMHALTAINISIFLVVNMLLFRAFLPLHLRVTRAVLFTGLGLIFYDAVWSLLKKDLISSQYFLIPLSFTIITFSLLILIHSRLVRLLKFRREFIPVIILFIILTYVMSLTFFPQWELYEAEFTNINPHGWLWLLHKTYSLWMWLVLALR